MSLKSFCEVDSNRSNFTNFTTIDDDELRLQHIKGVFALIQASFCVIGIGGNLLNLLTLCSPSLQTVPFMYIRAVACFDLMALSLIATHFLLVSFPNQSFYAVFYQTHIQDTVINMFLIGSLYCALMLTLERYVLISHPYHRRGNPKKMARVKIASMLMLAGVLHLPMSFQYTVAEATHDGQYYKSNNRQLICREPWFDIFNGYKLLRECLRFICVIVMTALNIVIARELQITKKNRRRLVLRPTTIASMPNKAIKEATPMLLSRREMFHLMRSFTERKLTALMIAICFIYIIGNIPQTLVMLLQSETTENMFGFQIYRNVANCLEILNHCLNFYVFCMASSDYTRAFLLNCLCIRRLLVKIPTCANFIYARRASSYFFVSQTASIAHLPHGIEDYDSRTTAAGSPDPPGRQTPNSRRCSATTAAAPLVLCNTAVVVENSNTDDENARDVVYL